MIVNKKQNISAISLTSTTAGFILFFGISRKIISKIKQKVYST